MIKDKEVGRGRARRRRRRRRKRERERERNKKRPRNSKTSEKSKNTEKQRELGGGGGGGGRGCVEEGATQSVQITITFAKYDLCSSFSWKNQYQFTNLQNSEKEWKIYTF